MFTGIVEEVGRVAAVGEGRLIVHAQTALDGTAVGDSVSVNGACLTVTDIQDDRVAFDLMPETLRRTNLAGAGPGSVVNLERSLALDGRIGGHLVQGHVDGTGRVLAMEPDGDAVVMRFSAPPEVLRYVVEKGFIAVDGVSLTVIGLDDESFSVSLVRFTLEHTVFGTMEPGSEVNLEIDILAKYTERLLGGGERGGPLVEIGGGSDAGC